MRELGVFAIALLVLVAPLQAAPYLNLAVTTDAPTYQLNDTITWTLSAWASTGDNRGIALLGVDLLLDRPETFAPALNDGMQLLETYYSMLNGFSLHTFGTPTGAGGSAQLLDVSVLQFPEDGEPGPFLFAGGGGGIHVFTQGMYPINDVGMPEH